MKKNCLAQWETKKQGKIVGLATVTFHLPSDPGNSEYDQMLEQEANNFKNNVALVVSTANRSGYECMKKEDRDIPDLEYYEPVKKGLTLEVSYIWPQLLQKEFRCWTR